MEKLKYGVIGLGWFGEMHAKVLSTLPDVELVAVCRRSLKPLKEIAKKYRVPYFYTDYRELLANKEISAVSITTHVDDHLKPTIAALRAGKNVLLEKPMAKNVRECQLIMKEVKKTDKFFMVGHICRFDPRYVIAKERIKKGEIGKIVSIYARRNIPAKRSESVLYKIGPILGDGIHDTDLMLWYTQSKIKTVYGSTLSVRKLPNPDLGWAMYRFENGAIGVIEDVWFLPEKTPYNLDARMEIIGTKGAIYIEGPGQTLAINTEKGWEQPETVYWPEFYEGRAGALKEELSYFVNCVLTGKKPTVISPEESMEAVRVVESAEKSARTGKIIKI